MKKVFISILHFNTKKETDECLRSLEKVDKKNIELITVLIDNASKEKYILPSGLKNNIHLIRNDTNLGFAGGHNAGIKYSLDQGADFVLILNNDILVEPAFIQELLNPFSESLVGVTVPKIYFTKGYEFHSGRYKDSEKGSVIWYAGGIIDWKNVISSHRGVDEIDRGQYNAQEPTEFATGACMMVRRDVFEKVGIFDERYFLYYEDGDLNMRIKNAGFKVIYVPRSIIWHNNAGSSGSGSVLQDYYISRNRLLFGLSYAPKRARAALIRESFKILVSGRKWQRVGVKDFYLRKFGRGSFIPGSS